MSEAALMLVATEIKTQLKWSGVTDLKERLLVAMRASRKYWMILDEQTQMWGAVTAVSVILKEEGNDEDCARLTQEIKALKTFEAFKNGIPVNFDAIGEPKNPISLGELWRIAKKKET